MRSSPTSSDEDQHDLAPEHHRSLLGRLALGAAVAAATAVPFLLLMLLVLSKWEPLENLDQSVAGDLHRVAEGRSGMVGFLEIVATVFSPNVFRLVIFGVVVWLWVKGARRVAVWATLTIAVGSLLAVVLKLLVARARPELPDPVASAGGYSFPSGHALGSMLGVGVLILIFLPVLSRGGRIAAYAVGAAVVLLIGYDRIALGVHFVSDVIAGWVVALAVLAGTSVAFEVWRRDRGERPSALSDGVDPEAAEKIRSR